MRTTVNLDADIVAAIEEARQRRGLGMSEAVNELARRGLTANLPARPTERFVQAVEPLGVRMNIDNTAEILDLLDGRP